MKKFFFLFAVLLLTVSFNNSESTILQATEIANNSCPMQVDFATTMDKVEYNPKTQAILYHYTVNEEYIPMTLLDESLDQVAETATAAMKIPETQSLIDACKDADVVIQFLYRGNQSAKSVSIIYDPSTDKTTLNHLN